jgi:hypothetical protein
MIWFFCNSSMPVDMACSDVLIVGAEVLLFVLFQRLNGDLSNSTSQSLLFLTARDRAASSKQYATHHSQGRIS